MEEEPVALIFSPVFLCHLVVAQNRSLLLDTAHYSWQAMNSNAVRHVPLILYKTPLPFSHTWRPLMPNSGIPHLLVFGWYQNKTIGQIKWYLPAINVFFFSQNCSSKYFIKQLAKSFKGVLACPKASKIQFTCKTMIKK